MKCSNPHERLSISRINQSIPVLNYSSSRLSFHQLFHGYFHQFISTLRQPFASQDKSSTGKSKLYALSTMSLEDSNPDFSPSSTDALVTETYKKTKTKPFYTYFFGYKGLFYSLLSSIFFSLSSVIVKYLKEVAFGELALVRFVGIFVFTLPILIYNREELYGPRSLRHLLILRGILGATSLYLRFLAFSYLSIGDASAIVFSIPIFVFVAARIFLKEPCGLIQSCSVLLTFIGIILIAKLPLINNAYAYDTQHIYGVAGALGSTIFGASVYVVMRKLSDVQNSVILFNYSWVAIVESVILISITDKFTAPPCGLGQWLMSALGIFSFCGQMLLTCALKEEHAGPVATVRAGADIGFAFLWQIWFFNDIPDVYSILGALFVSSSVLLLSFQKFRTQK